MNKFSKAEYNYDDLLNMEHHTSLTHPHMSISDRAAQFAPFAALTGFEDEVKETARLTNEKIELDENAKIILNDKLNLILENIVHKPEASICFFNPDNRKEGGAYITVRGNVKKMDLYRRVVIMMDNLEIPIDDIIDIELD